MEQVGGGLTVELARVGADEKPVLRQMMELYQYDFSEFEGSDIDDHGYYGYRYLDHYWTDEDRDAFFIKADGNYAGFVMVNEHGRLIQEAGAKSIAEFFVMKKYRRLGIGRFAAVETFRRFPGQWEVCRHDNNEAAVAFWAKVIGAFTGGEFHSECVLDDGCPGQVLLFDNPR